MAAGTPDLLAQPLHLQQRPEGPSYAQQAQQAAVGAVQPYMDLAGPYIDKAVQLNEEYPLVGQAAQLAAWPVNAAVAAGGVAQAINDQDPVGGMAAAVGGIPLLGRFAKAGVLAGTKKSVQQLQQLRSMGMAPSSDMMQAAARRVGGDAGALYQTGQLGGASYDQTLRAQKRHPGNPFFGGFPPGSN